MASILSGYEYDIFVSYRHNDNKYDGWVSEFVEKLKQELDATLKDKLTAMIDLISHLASLYFILNSANLLPPLYNRSLPNGYSKVVGQWQKDKSKTDPADFEQAYKKFLEGK